jgi:hypothetical protein
VQTQFFELPGGFDHRAETRKAAAFVPGALTA